MTIWRDIIEPPSHDYLWYRLNEYNGLVGIFKYKEDKWVLIKKKELEEMMSGGNAEDIINQITNGAPQNLDSFVEVANVLNDLANVAYSGSYEDLADKPTIPTATSFKSFKSSWPTSTTIEAFCQAVMNDPDAVVGMAYFGALDCSGLPSGLRIGDTVVEILGTNNNKVVHLSISSTNLAPYNWEGSYWQGSFYGWRSFYIKPQTGIPGSDLASGVIPDVSAFITKSVNDLTNYYLKSETYTKAEVAALIGAIQQFHYEIYASTSEVTSPANNVLYLIGPTGTGADKYEEYVYDATKQNPWVKIGDTSIDLSGYVTTSDLNTALANYTTTANLTTLLAGKQDKIDSTHKLDYSLVDNTPAIPDAVEANPTVPAGTTPSDLTGLKVGNNYYGIPALPSVDNTPTANSNNLVKSGGVYDAINPSVQSSQPQGGFLPNVVYDLGELTGSVTFALAAGVTGKVNAYHWTFDTGSTAPTITWPAGIIWSDDVTPTVEASKHYEVLVRNGYASMLSYSLS